MNRGGAIRVVHPVRGNESVCFWVVKTRNLPRPFIGNDDPDPISRLWVLHPLPVSQPCRVRVIEETRPWLGQIGYHDRTPVPKLPQRHFAEAKCCVWPGRIRSVVRDHNPKVPVQGIRADVIRQDLKPFLGG
jgi:hypothetical protein